MRAERYSVSRHVPSLGGSRGLHAEWDERVTKGLILYDSTGQEEGSGSECVMGTESPSGTTTSSGGAGHTALPTAPQPLTAH